MRPQFTCHLPWVTHGPGLPARTRNRDFVYNCCLFSLFNRCGHCCHCSNLCQSSHYSLTNSLHHPSRRFQRISGQSQHFLALSSIIFYFVLIDLAIRSRLPKHSYSHECLEHRAYHPHRHSHLWP